MAMVSFGDLAQSFLLKSQTTRLKNDVGRLTQELASGLRTDVGAAVSGDMARLAALSRSHDMATGYLGAANEAAFRAASVQSVLATLSQNALDLAPELLKAPQTGSTDTLGLLTVQAKERLTSSISMLNTSAGGRALLAGDQVGETAVVDADTILDALRAELAGTTTAEDAMARISVWFDAPTGFTAVAYTGGAPVADMAVSPDDRIWMGVTANDTAFREALKGFAAAALVGDLTVGLPDGDNRTLARLAGERLMGGNDALTALGAKIGVSESRISNAISRNSSEQLALEMAKGDILKSDPFSVATELEAVQTNLEMLYSVTARLSRLNLTDFIR